MLERRCAGVYAGLIAAMMGLVLRLYILSQSAYYAAVAGGTEQLAAGGGHQPGADL